MLACSFLIESSSKLLVTRTGIKARSSSILGRIRPLILELLALKWRKFHTFELEYFWSQLANLDQILCVASLGWGKGCIRFWGRLILAHWTQVSDRCPLGYMLNIKTDLPYGSFASNHEYIINVNSDLLAGVQFHRRESLFLNCSKENTVTIRSVLSWVKINKYQFSVPITWYNLFHLLKKINFHCCLNSQALPFQTFKWNEIQM